MKQIEVKKDILGAHEKIAQENRDFFNKNGIFVLNLMSSPGAGKTTLALSIIAETQRRKGVSAFIDAEHAFDPSYAKIIGVNLDDLLISQPDTGEQALEITETLVRSNAVDLVVIDSVAALVPRAEIEGEMGEAQMGLQARLMSQALRKLTAAISKSKTCVIFINQIRMKIGIMFGNPETTTGGNALKFYASVRVDIRKIGSKKEGDKVISNTTKVKIVKNKVHPPFKECLVDIRFGVGIDNISGLIDTCIEKDIIKKSGAWLSIAGHEKKYRWQGKEKARKASSRFQVQS